MCAHVVLRDASPVVVHEAEVSLSIGVPLRSSHPIPLNGLGVVLGNAFAVVVHEAEVVLSIGVPLLGPSS